MNTWLFHQNEFTRTTLSAIVSKFVEEIEFPFFLHRQDSLVQVNSVNLCPTCHSVCPTCSKIVSEYDQEIPQSQTADNSMAPRGRAAQPPRDTRKTN